MLCGDHRRYAVKHEGVKHSILTPIKSSGLQLPRATMLLRSIQPWLQGQKGKPPTYAEMAAWGNVPEGTVRDWFSGMGHPSAEFLLSLLDRTDEETSQRILGKARKLFPSLDHSLLMNDKAVISRLKTIMAQRGGLTFIQSDNDEHRTFLTTALGHTYLHLTQPPRQVVGIDIHEHDWFVPIPGVSYLHNTFAPDQIRMHARQAWPQPSSVATLVIFNGLWSAVPELQKDIRLIAETWPVIVTDEVMMDIAQMRVRPPHATNMITIASARPNHLGLSMIIRTC